MLVYAQLLRHTERDGMLNLYGKLRFKVFCESFEIGGICKLLHCQQECLFAPSDRAVERLATENILSIVLIATYRPSGVSVGIDMIESFQH